MLMNDAESRMNSGDEARRQFFDASQRANHLRLKDVEGNAIRCPRWSNFTIGP
jgi:hypothetical protein